MPKLISKRGEWELPHVHMWKDRSREIKFDKKPIILRKNKIATIGSCFAEAIAGAMSRRKLNAGMHPTGLFYNTRSIRQEVERIFGRWPEYYCEPLWETTTGFIHPFKNYKICFPSEAALGTWSDELDRRSEVLFKKADVIIITLGLVEIWMNPKTESAYRQIPHPEVFERLGPSFHRLAVSEMIEDLNRIRAVLREETNSEIILTVSPVPLHATITPLDVRIANSDSKSRIRAAVSEFIELHPDIHYFHSYETVTTGERPTDFMIDDGRHIHRKAEDYIVQQFLAMYACNDIQVPELDTSWITQPTKSAERVVAVKPSFIRRIISGIFPKSKKPE